MDGPISELSTLVLMGLFSGRGLFVHHHSGRSIATSHGLIPKTYIGLRLVKYHNLARSLSLDVLAYGLFSWGVPLGFQANSYMFHPASHTRWALGLYPSYPVIRPFNL